MCRVDLRRHLSKHLGVDLLAELHSQRLVLLLLQTTDLVGDLPDPRHSVVVRLRDLDRLRVPPVDDVALDVASGVASGADLCSRGGTPATAPGLA
jgi:hypothetical protein